MSSEVKKYLVNQDNMMPECAADFMQAGWVEVRLESDYAALEAENARLLAANLDCVAHFEQMRAQLAAIQGGIGERNERKAFDDACWHKKGGVVGNMCPAEAAEWAWFECASQHQRITAAMAAEVQTWKQLHADAQELYADAMIAIGKELGIDVSDEPRCKHVSAQAMAMAAELERLKERYECNTAIMHARTEALSRVTKERDALRAELETLRKDASAEMENKSL